VMFSDSAGFTAWCDPILVDDSGTCRGLNVILIGSDAQNTSYLFATYLADGTDGETQINYRDLKLIKSEQFD
jgi:hypothetical protein